MLFTPNLKLHRYIISKFSKEKKTYLDLNQLSYTAVLIKYVLLGKRSSLVNLTEPVTAEAYRVRFFLYAHQN